MSQKIGIRLLGLLVSTASLAVALPVHAQDAGENNDRSEQAPDRDVIDVIVVTARFREESIQDVGASVTGISGEDVEVHGVRDVDDLARLVPGMQSVKSRQNSNDIAIRGVISAGSGRETSTVFSVFLDDVSVTGSGNLRDFSSVDLNRIEVIRGPQPTLFGEGAVGGVIRYFTNDPDLDGPTFTGVARGRFGSIEDGGSAYSGESAASIVFSPDKVGLRLSGFYRNDEGFIDNPSEGEDVNDFDTYGGRAVLLAQPTDDLQIRLSAFSSRDESGESTQVDPGSDPEGLTFSASPISGDFKDNFDLYTGRVSYDFGGLELTSITGYYERRTNSSLFSAGNTFGLAPFFASDAPGAVIDTTSFLTTEGQFEQWSEEFRFVSDFDGPLNFTSGFYFRDRDSVLGAFVACEGCASVTTPPSPNLATELNRTETRQYSGFVEFTYDLSERLRVIGGGRYVNDTVTATLVRNDTIALVPRFDGGGNIIPWTESDPIGFSNNLDIFNALGVGTQFEFELDRFLPRGGIEYDWGDDTMLYLNAAVGARNGGVGQAISALASSGGDPDQFLNDVIFDEDSVFSVDGGVKTLWLDGDLTANLGVFYSQYEDTQILVSSVASTTTNGPEQRLIGAELETAYRVSDNFSTFFNASVLDAEFTEDFTTVATPPAGQPAPFFDLMEGNSPAHAPKLTFASGYTYSYPLGLNGLRLTSNGAFHYVGERNTQVQNYPSTELDSLEILNLRIGIENDVWAVNFVATNLLNDIEEVDMAANSLAHFINANGILDADPTSANVNRPRTLGVNLSLRF